MARKKVVAEEVAQVEVQDQDQSTGHEYDFLGEHEQQVNTDTPDQAGQDQTGHEQAPSAEEAAAEAKDERKWHNAEGQEVSKSEFIREQFTKHNLSRKQISEQFDINYRTVYGATVNMVNDAEPATRGRSAGQSKINVTADGKVISIVKGEEGDVVHVDNVAVKTSVEQIFEVYGETTEVDRNTWIQDQVAAGRARGEVANALGLSYGVVYSLTKEVDGATQRHEMEYNGEKISRSEYIRRRFAEGVSKSDIAKELGVDYPVVWSALKSLKSEDEKFHDAVERVAKFADKVEDVEAFNQLIETLKAVQFKVEEPAETTETTEEAQQPSEETVYADAE